MFSLRPFRTLSKLPALGLAIASLPIAGCGSGGEDAVQEPFSVQDSAGLQIVVSGSPLWANGEGWTVELEPAVILGPDFAEGRFLHRVRNMERLEDGRVVIENQGSKELLVFDSTGVFLEAWGGEGQGPGEFWQMFRLFGCGEELLAEVELRRVSFFDSQGRFQRTVRVPAGMLGSGKQVHGLGADCGSIFAVGMVRAYEPTGFGTHHYPVQPLWGALDGSSIDTLGTFLGHESLADRSGRPAFLLPFAYRANWATDGRVLYYGWGDRPEVTMLSPEGSVIRILRWAAPPDPITEADWAAYEADLEAERATAPRQASVLLPGREEHPHPTLKPYFGPPDLPDAQGSAFLVDDQGHLWVRQFTRHLAAENPPPGPLRWWVFDPSGRWLGGVQTPEGFELRNIRGGLLLGVFRGELGAEEVRVYRINSHDD